jgi:hypothetical protein
MFTWTKFRSSFWLISAIGVKLLVNFDLSKLLSDYSMFTWTPNRSSFWLISTTGGLLLVYFDLSKIFSDYVQLDTVQVKLLADLSNWRNTFGEFLHFQNIV